jgi:hypothetical protein
MTLNMSLNGTLNGTLNLRIREDSPMTSATRLMIGLATLTTVRQGKDLG